MRTLEYKDVGLITRHISQIKSRADVNISTWFGDILLDIPMLASPMPDVCDGNMAKTIRQCGAFGFIHRFMSVEEQIQHHNRAPNACGCAVGIGQAGLDRFETLYEAGCRFFCVDVANGANYHVGKHLEKLCAFDDAYIIAGNVHTKEGFEFLQQFPLLGIRCGIAGGSVCSTKIETGIYQPIVNVILECASIKDGPLLIADSGIKQPQDMCKALALGADLVMAGNLFAATRESPAKTIKQEGSLYKLYRGAASFSVQQDNDKKPQYVEGIEKIIPYSGPVENVLTRFRNGLRSSMSYMNAHTIEEYQKHVEWCII